MRRSRASAPSSAGKERTSPPGLPRWPPRSRRTTAFASPRRTTPPPAAICSTSPETRCGSRGSRFLEIQDSAGRILSSGHFRNAFDRLEPALPRALGGANGPALVRDRTATGSVTVLARVDSFRVAGRRFTVAGGTCADGFVARLPHTHDLTSPSRLAPGLPPYRHTALPPWPDRPSHSLSRPRSRRHRRSTPRGSWRRDRRRRSRSSAGAWRRGASLRWPPRLRLPCCSPPGWPRGSTARSRRWPRRPPRSISTASTRTSPPTAPMRSARSRGCSAP